MAKKSTGLAELRNTFYAVKSEGRGISCFFLLANPQPLCYHVFVSEMKRDSGRRAYHAE